jgi:histidinol-phosphate/aromatic aminotransferase/cobyric acid decarboxylase-like protein/ubiquinone/menaquinone biosynthesis C-methylase UbiE
MGSRWYEDYFGSTFWAFADHEYTRDRSAREFSYLDQVLTALAPGKRVLDLGCGIGRHAIPLARAGYRVTGVDISKAALDRAQAAAAEAGVEVEWLQLDLMRARSRDVPSADAAICIQAFGWGEDAEQLRLLRTIRRQLRSDGIIILDHSNPTAILQAYVPKAEVEIGGEQFRFLRSFDPMTGRSRGELSVTRRDDGISRVRDDLRLYQPHEIRRLLLAGGFEIRQVDADFRIGARSGQDTRYIQFVAQRHEQAEAGTRVGFRVSDTRARLDLSWAPDEAEYVRGALDKAWRKNLHPQLRLRDRQLRHYALDDPFGERAAAHLATHFNWHIEPEMVCLGAGSTGILRALGILAAPGTVIQSPYGHPELAATARRLGSDTVFVDPVGDPEHLTEALDRNPAAVVVVDRPGIQGQLYSLETIANLASVVARAGAILVVDETCANYAGPGASAVSIIGRADNLVVVRSMSKGYCCGGLRVGFALSAPDLGREIREVATPLGVSEFSLSAALALLAQGDIFEPLRQRIGFMKPVLVAGLRQHGITARIGDPTLPWVTSSAATTAKATLRKLGITPRQFEYSVNGSNKRKLLRLSVPLSEDRANVFRTTVDPSGSEPI